MGGRNIRVTLFCSIESSISPGLTFLCTIVVPPSAKTGKQIEPAAWVIGAAISWTGGAGSGMCAAKARFMNSPTR